MDTGPIRASEIEAALSTMKMGKAPGEDLISANMLKADITLTAQALHGVINQIWTNEHVPNDWKIGTIIPLPKKGDLSQCNNW